MFGPFIVFVLVVVLVLVLDFARVFEDEDENEEDGDKPSMHHNRSKKGFANRTFPPLNFMEMQPEQKETRSVDATTLDEVQRTAQEQFARQSHRYGQGHILENVSDVQTALAQVSLPPSARVLDVATGAGHTGLYLASLGHDVTLSDIAAPMLERASEAAMRRGLVVQTRQHTAEELPYPEESFDLVTCRVAPHHFSSPAKWMAEVSRVLKPGGWLVLIDGSVEDDQVEAEEWLHAVEKLRDPSHHRFLTPRAWRLLCEQNGLAVRHCELAPFKQPDLNWYFDTAATPPENRRRALELVAKAPAAASALFRLGEENGKIVWWWQRLTLVAQKARI